MGQFDFSVVMAVYNVENYLHEAVESLVHQTIGFSHIQLIMVDDGSTDSSGKICDEYKKKYPENVVVIHKENGRQASARNEGLPYVQGRYVNFLDPDDILDMDAMEKVEAFMNVHPDVDVCSIPLILFGNVEGEHYLNHKYHKGTRAINLLEKGEETNIQLHISSAFCRAESVQGLKFDTSLQTAEDAKLLMEILMKTPRLGVVSDSKYNYRQHASSSLQNCRFQKRWYIPQLHGFSEWALDEAQHRYGIIPKFVQHTIMYDLQGRIQQKQLQPDVLSQKEADEYRALLLSIAARIDMEVINSMEFLTSAQKFHIIRNKAEGYIEKRIVKEDVCFLLENDIALKVSEMDTILEFLSFSSENCILEGYHVLCGIEPNEVEPCLLINDEVLNVRIIERKNCVRRCLGEKIAYAVGFQAVIPLGKKRITIQPAIKYLGVTIKRTSLILERFFPLTGTYENSSYTGNKYTAAINGNTLDIRPKPFFPARIAHEINLLIEIWKKNLLGGRKAIAGRLYYHIMHPFKVRKWWIISDRIMKADDNGEILFKYIRDHQPIRVKVVFVISKKSADYPRLQKIGQCVDAMSFRHKLMHLLCDINISAQADAVTVNPFAGHDEALRDLLCHQNFVFLQHGVTKEDISGWLNRYSQNFSGFVTAAKSEYQSIVDGDYGYTKNEVWLTGFPRFDDLYHDEKKIITVMPTWREYLMVGMDWNSGLWKPANTFTSSVFFAFYNNLLTSNRLLSVLEDAGYRLQFFPHPNLQQAVHLFTHDRRVEFLPLNTSYRKVYAESNLVITDFSSAIFDFVYLRKPVIYCHFDGDTVLGGSHVYKQGYFSYERDGFGEVVYDLDSTIDLIIDYVRNDCQLKDLYQSRIDNFFAYSDRDNCKRVFEKIMELD